MLLTITTTSTPATDLGYLLHKHPERLQSLPVASGTAYVFCPGAEPDRCTAALREYALGTEALDRMARGEPLWRVHEFVFGVLAPESEPVDPRL